MPLLYAILVALFLIGLIVSLVFAAKHWHWLHITAVVLVFLTAVPAVYCIGYVMKTRSALVKVAEQNATQVEAARDNYDDILFGDEPGPGGGYGEGSRNETLVRLKRLNLGKGRTWDNGSISGVMDNQITIDFPAPQPADPAAADDQNADNSGRYPSSGSLVYIFQTVGVNGTAGQQIPVPGDFLGTFEVTQVGNQQITTSGQLVLGSPENGTAVYIYEKPPTDFHGNMYRAMGLETDELPEIDVVRTKFEESFPFDSLFAENTPENMDWYNQLVDEVSFDRRPITEINQWLQAKGRGSWEPSPQEVRVRVRVLEDITQGVNGNQDVLVNGEYDGLGRTNNPNLKLPNDDATVKRSTQGDDTDFWLVDEPTATLGYPQPDNQPAIRSLEEEGKIEPIERIYYRPLRDYTTEIAQTLQDVELLEARVAEYDRYSATSAKMLEDAKSQQILRDEKISRLTADQQNLERDLASINQYSSEMEAKLAQLKQQMRATYLQISYIHQQRERFESLVTPSAN